MIGLFVDRLQLLEAIIVDFRDERHIDGGAGVQLDNLALFFQETRGGLGDEPFRAAIKNAYTKKAKSGEPETLIQAYAAYTNATRITLTRYRPCTVILNAEVPSTSLASVDHINKGMKRIKAAGIEIDTTLSLDSGAFSFIKLGDLPDPSLGWSSIANPTAGGTFAGKI